MSFSFFFFNDTATTEIYTLSLHDALPICQVVQLAGGHADAVRADHRDGVHSDPLAGRLAVQVHGQQVDRSEEHTSELQSQSNLVCRLLLEKKKKNKIQQM